MSRITIRRSMSTILIITTFMLMSISSSAYAQTNYDPTKELNSNNNVQVSVLNDTTIKIVDGDTVGTVTILKDTSTTREVLISTLNGSNEKEDILLTTDKIASTITSSKTNEVISMDSGMKMLGMAAAPKVGDTKTVRISFETIKDSIGVGSAIIGVAGFIASFYSGAGAAFIATLATRLGGIVGLYSLISKGSPNHGIKITSEYHIRSTTKNGKVYKYGDWKLISISTY